jgi:hypothetical protein
MDTHDFLQRVLPTEGTVVSIVINPGDRPRQKFYDTIQELADASVKLSNHGHNVYYAVASFNDATARKQSNVNKLKALYLDIDCGPEKPFASPVDGARALSKFLSETGLPKPLTVLSGKRRRGARLRHCCIAHRQRPCLMLWLANRSSHHRTL